MSTRTIMVTCPSGLSHGCVEDSWNEDLQEKEYQYWCPCGYAAPKFHSEVTARMAWDRICPKHTVPSVGVAVSPAAAAVPHSGHVAALGVISSVIEAALTEGVPFASLQVQIVGVGAFAVKVERLQEVSAQQLPLPGVGNV